MRKRRTHRGLTNSRIYIRGRKFYLFSAEAIQNPATGKTTKWIPLCAVSEGEDKARQIAAEIRRHNAQEPTIGDMPGHLETYRLKLLQKREKDRPKEAARALLFDQASREYTRVIRVISEAFQNFDVEQVLPVDVAKFVDQWEGQRMGQVYHSRISDFFGWACRRGIRADNPCREVKIDKPGARTVYITDAEFYSIFDALAIGKDGRKTPSGQMVKCYVALCYLLYQRTTEIRLLKWSQIQGDFIHFKPTKTEASSGATVAVPITPAIREWLEKARSIGTVKGIYVIHTKNGQPYTTNGIGTAWKRATARAGVAGRTLKDLRAKALTDAKKAGYEMKQLAVAAAHTDEAMTADYIKRRETPISEVQMAMPKR